MIPGLALAAALVAYNTAVAVARVGSAVLVPLNVGVGTALVAGGIAGGLSLEAMALGTEALGAGLRWGAFLALLVPIGLGVTLLVPGGMRLLRDVRLAGLSPAELLFTVLVRIPLATALFEEVAFRGVLLATLARHTSTPAAVAISSVAFGLWHVGPAWVRSEANRPNTRWPSRLPELAGAVLMTAVGGAVFAVLRIETGSVAAPALIHAAANVAGALAAVWAGRR